MYKSKHIIGKRNGKIHRFALFFTVLMLLCGVLLLFHFTPSHVSAGENSRVNKLQNGSFEEGQTWTKTYQQLDQSVVPSWNTTAFQGEYMTQYSWAEVTCGMLWNNKYEFLQNK